jgi:hypothetical protein
VPAELEPVFNGARSREKTRLADIFTRAVAENKLKIDDPRKMAELLHDCLDGLRIAVISHKMNFFPDKNQFYELVNREKEVVRIFIRGLST